jgi:hypothetical protein
VPAGALGISIIIGACRAPAVRRAGNG